MIVIIDNYDSFTYNLVQLFGSVSKKSITILRNEIKPEEIPTKITHLILSPGPSNPKNSGQSPTILEYFAGKLPILGVCLGHQIIGDFFGCSVVHASKPTHGKTSIIEHNKEGLFKNLPIEIKVARYHSLIVDQKNFNHKDLMITAQTQDGLIMGIKHRHIEHIEGIQFHLESFLTEYGSIMCENFLAQV